MAAAAEPVPWIGGRSRDRLQARVHGGVQLRHQGLQQALLVAEVVIQRATGEPCLRGQIVHRGVRIALRGEHCMRGGQQGGAGLFHLGTGTAGHRLSSLHTVRMIIYIRPVCI
ncbi:hypothetical protein D3C71_1408370 [compost metagenome]